MSLSRRRFLQVAAAAGAAGAIGGLPRVAGAAAGAPTAVGEGTLVLVTLYGGNDALNTVVPVEDSAYRSARGALAVDPAAARALGDGFSLHPALPGCKALWDEQRLAIVHGVGFPDLDRSHFHCMDVWQAGDPDDVATGWLGRWLDAVGRDPLDAVAVGTSLPLLLRGARRSAAVVPAGPFVLPGDERLRALVAQVSRPAGGRSPLAALVASSTADLLAVVDDVGPVVASVSATDDALGNAEAANDGRNSGLAAQLDVVAASIEAGLPARAYAVDLGGFDTHANQAAVHEELLGELDGALSSFVARVADRPVTVAVYSEFGRRVAANGSAGTDHGRAGTVLLAGRVRPGFHGDPPPLDRLTDGDLTSTVDFRSVLGGLLEGVLGMPATDVFAAAPRPMTLV